MYKKGNFRTDVGSSGDVDLVHRIAVETDTIFLYQENMIVTHLEIEKLSQWYKKIYSYGKNNEFLTKDNFRNLSLMENLVIYFQTFKKSQKSVTSAILLMGVLVPGFFLYIKGRMVFYLQKLRQIKKS